MSEASSRMRNPSCSIEKNVSNSLVDRVPKNLIALEPTSSFLHLDDVP